MPKRGVPSGSELRLWADAAIGLPPLLIFARMRSFTPAPAKRPLRTTDNQERPRQGRE